MARRSDQRREAAFALYQHDLTGRSLDDVLGHDASRFTRSLAHAADDYAPDLDAILERHSHGWTVDRMPGVDRSLLRLATWELLWNDDVPDAVAIDEAVQLASSLSTDESPAFVNGLLARLLQVKPSALG